jgi:hypothetical protein
MTGWWFVSAATVGFLFALLAPVARQSVVPMMLFVTSPWSSGASAVCVALAYLVISIPIVAGHRNVTSHGLIILLLYLAMQCVYSVATWREGVLRYGLGHTVEVNVIALSAVAALTILYINQRGRPSVRKAVTFYAGATLWPWLVAFPFLFEGP